MAYRLQNQSKSPSQAPKQGALAAETVVDLVNCAPSYGRIRRGYAGMFRTLRMLVLLVLAFGISTPVLAVDFDASMTLVMERAKQLALDNGQWPVTAEHLTLALLESIGQGDTPHLTAAKSTYLLTDEKLNAAIEAVDTLMVALPKSTPSAGGKDLMAPNMEAWIKSAEKLANANKQNLITPSHLLVAMTDAGFPAPITSAVAPLGLERETLLKQSEIKKAPAVAEDGKRVSYLERFTTDRSAGIKAGILGHEAPLGTAAHVQTALTTLNKPARTANAPLLVGEGDLSEIADGLAFRIADGNVPPRLQRKRVLVLDIEGMKAGTKYRGALEQRVKRVIKEAEEAGDVILYVPNMERAMAGKDSEGGDISGPLRKALNEGKLMILASTTAEGARKIEGDTQLSQTMQKQPVAPMTDGMAFYYIKQAKAKWEEEYQIKISDKAISAAIEQSNRLLTGAQPRLAMDVLADAASRFSIEMHAAQPTAITGGLMEEIESKKAQIENIRTLPDSRRRDGDLNRALEELGKLELRASDISAGWERGLEIKAEMKTIIWDDERTALRRDQLKAELDGISARLHLFLPELDERHVVEVIAAKTGRPSDKIGLSRRERVALLVPTMKDKVIGQNHAIDEVGAVARRGAMGLTSPKRPQGSFLFYGPTGVGKTELATVLAEVLYDDPSALITIPGSEYMEKANLSKLLGAPPGYVGFEDTTGKLEEVRQRPYSVVLFDEIEKFHPDIYKMLLEVLEKGRATDSHGRLIRFNNTIIVFTSNLGKDIAARTDITQEEKFELMKQQFADAGVPPEFVGRIYSKIGFASLTQADLEKIVELELKKANQDIFRGANVEVSVLPEARKRIAELGYDPSQGARLLRRSTGVHVEDPISDAIANHEEEVEKSGRFEVGLDEKGENFTLSILKPEAQPLAEGQTRCSDYFRQIPVPAKKIKGETPQAPKPSTPMISEANALGAPPAPRPVPPAPKSSIWTPGQP